MTSKDVNSLCEAIRIADSSIMSLTISDKDGLVLATSYGSEYQKHYLEKATKLRGKAGVLSALMMGMEEQADEVFGKTEAVIRVHEKAKLVVIPFASKTKIVTLLCEKEANVNNLLLRILPLLQD